LGEEKRGVRVWRTLRRILEKRRGAQGFEHVFLSKEGAS
jgi:hypothetical protein